MWKLAEFYYIPKQSEFYNTKTPQRNTTAINNRISQRRNIAGSFTELRFTTQWTGKACYSQTTEYNRQEFLVSCPQIDTLYNGIHLETHVLQQWRY